LADDFKTTEGKEYKNATLFCVEPDGIDIKTKSGISKVYFSELPQEVQDRFHHGSQWSAQHPARANEEIRITQQQKIEEDQKREDEAPGNLEIEEQQQRSVLAKAESIRIPYIEFRDVTVREAVDFLVAQRQKTDPGGTGVVIGISLNDTEPGTSNSSTYAFTSRRNTFSSGYSSCSTTRFISQCRIFRASHILRAQRVPGLEKMCAQL
jgi:hypothetical protein